MPITIKNHSEIIKMRAVCRVVADTLDFIKQNISVGVTTSYIDKIAEEFIRSRNAIPSSKNYHGFPASICVSVNEQVIHGIPGKRKLLDGDIVSVDLTALLDGYNGDAARTFIVGSTSRENQKLVDVTKQSFFEGIKFAKAGHHLFEISAAIQDFVEANGFSVVKDYVGHGIGTQMHEAPEVPNYRQNKRGPKLVSGMTLAIEPMVNAGGDKVILLDDGWTVVTADNSYAAHYENTVLITDGEPEILTTTSLI